MDNLKNKIINHIRHFGPIGIDCFMEIALYDPQYGYYKSQNAIGKEADFITAPEIGQIFGEMIGVWIASSWYDLGQPKSFKLLEFGAGRGTMMRDTLKVIKQAGIGIETFEIIIIECNETLRNIQKNTLIGNNINWFEDLNKAKLEDINCPIIMIGNEFFDCLPIKQFIKNQNEAWHERQIGIDNNKNLIFGLSPEMGNFFEKDKDFLESCTLCRPIIDKIAQILLNNKGRATFIDYGYYNENHGDTFQALHRHKKISPLEYIGEADLTAHVDFKAIENHANAAGLYVQPIISQRDFLLSLGAQIRADALIDKNPDKKDTISSSIDRLINVNEMGNLFKVIIMENL